MVEFANLVLISFIVCSPFVFLSMTAERALVSIFWISFLWLPQIEFPVPFLGALSHGNIPCLCSLVGLLISDSKRQSVLSLNVLDMPVLAAAVCPMISSLTNGLGPYDGAAASTGYFLNYTAPFLLGRFFLATPGGSRLLARGFIVGGLAYIVPCLIEIRLSPVLHYWFYGKSLFGGMRLGGYRPSVFMNTGLQLGLWMSNCTIVALCCALDPFRSKKQKQGDAKAFWVIFLVTVLCRSTGAFSILLSGITALVPLRLHRSRIGLSCLLLLAPLYFLTRLTGNWDGRSLVDWSSHVDQNQAGSLEFRMKNEDLLMDKALEHPLLGWGGWYRSRVNDPNRSNKAAVTDGRWIIYLGENGLAGMFCDYWTLLLPLLLVILRWRLLWNCPDNIAAIVSISMVCAFLAIDSLANNMPNPYYWLCAGAVSGIGAYLPADSTPSGTSYQVASPRVRRSLQFSHSQPPASPSEPS